MSELTTICTKTSPFRWHLLATASIAALTALGVSPSVAEAENTFLSDSDHPSFWIELGGDFERISGQTDKWAPPARVQFSGNGLDIRKDASGSFGIEGKVSYQPTDSPWIVFAAARYGRAQRQQSFHTQEPIVAYINANLHASNYNATTRHTENHMVVDFQVGRDFGLGLQGKYGHAVLGAGVRIAQFSLDAEEFASSHPNSGFFRRKLYDESENIERRTSAMGPAISLNASTPLMSTDGGGLMFDWGASGAVLFGRQKVTTQSISHYQYAYNGTDRQSSGVSNSSRAKSVVIPNVGVFAGVSYRLPAARVALGYRADLYFNGVDGGVNAANSIDHSFYGPFATISFGLGG